MRICDVNNFYSPRGGGVRIYHEQKLAYFESQDEHSYALVVPSKRSAVQRRGSASIYEVPALPYVNPDYRCLASPRPLITVLDDFRPDLVEVGSAYLMPYLVNRAHRGRSFATVGFYHCDYPDTYVGRPLATWSEGLGRRMAAVATRHASRVYRRMTATFAASEYALNKLHEAGVRRLFKTPLGVDGELFCPERRCGDLRQALGEGREKIVLFMARLAGEKGIGQLLEAYPLFRDPDKLALVIVGKGRWQRSVERAAEQYQEIKYIPYLNDHEEVARLMASCDAFLALGQHETFSLTTLEAMACGRVVVAPDSGGAAELVAGAGVLSPFPTGGPEALAAAVEAGLAIRDEECPRKLRRYATENFAWRASFQRICGFYDRIVDALHADDLDRLSPTGKWHE
jgi:alpha-1,6-mannosyltransferase